MNWQRRKRIKSKWVIVKKYSPWLGAMLSMDVFFCLLLWIADAQALIIFAVVLTLTALLMFAGILGVILCRELKRREAFENFIYAPNELNEEMLGVLCSSADAAMIALLGRELRKQQLEGEQLLTRLWDYEEYVEAWAHEIKTPIFLLTILLDNHSQEMPKNISVKLDYIRNRMQAYVEQILFYARLKSGKKDYIFEFMSLSECLGEILEDYRPLLEEKNFQVKLPRLEEKVYSDRRGLKFILSQIVSNALKYTKKDTDPELCISYEKSENASILSIADKGIGVRVSDLPYIWEKGFTGDTGENQKRATGMGLYLVKEIAGDLKLSLEACSEWQKGFEIRIIFPIIEGEP